MTTIESVRQELAKGKWTPYTVASSMSCSSDIGSSDGNAFWPTINFPDYAKPVFPKTRIILTGLQGVGKSTLFNRLTGANSKTSIGRMTCTRKNYETNCKKPFDQVYVVDTPGVGGSGDIDYSDTDQLREALIRKPVNMIAIVASLPLNPRAAEIITTLKPMDKIMNSSTFKLDTNGIVNPSMSTHVFLVLTNRDTFREILPKKNWPEYIATIRAAYSWIGGVIMIDQSVSDVWLFSNIVILAACHESRDYYIPRIEFCSRFPLSRKLDPAETLEIIQKKIEFNEGMNLAIEELDSITYGQQLDPTIDSIFQFLEDLFKCVSLEAVALLQNVKVDNLWMGSDEVNQLRVELWDAVQCEMGDVYEYAKLRLLKKFPTRLTDGIYRRCNYCHMVYLKPVGCDFETICGNSRDGGDSLLYTYEYKKGESFKILKYGTMGNFKRYAYKLRKQFTKVLGNIQRFYGIDAAIMNAQNFEPGCGKPIKWNTMIPLTREELWKHELIPRNIKDEPPRPKDVGPDKPKLNIQAKLRSIVNFLEVDNRLTMMAKIKTAENKLFGVEGKGGARRRIDRLYEKINNDEEKKEQDPPKVLKDGHNIPTENTKGSNTSGHNIPSESSKGSETSEYYRNLWTMAVIIIVLSGFLCHPLTRK